VQKRRLRGTFSRGIVKERAACCDACLFFEEIAGMSAEKELLDRITQVMFWAFHVMRDAVSLVLARARLLIISTHPLQTSAFSHFLQGAPRALDAATSSQSTAASAAAAAARGIVE
jgi:hypothetical protein